MEKKESGREVAQATRDEKEEEEGKEVERKYSLLFTYPLRDQPSALDTQMNFDTSCRSSSTHIQRLIDLVVAIP